MKVKVTEHITSSVVGTQKAAKVLVDKLKLKLLWLDNVYSVAKIVKEGPSVVPTILTSPTEYLSLIPASDLGNYCFFVSEDPTTVISNSHKVTELVNKVSLIIWFDSRLVNLADDMFNTEQAKLTILDAVNSLRVENINFKVDKVWERTENVFKGFTLNTGKAQYQMAPYYGFRLEGVLTVKRPCTT